MITALQVLRRWLTQCPGEVIDRVVIHQEDLRFIASTSHIYSKDMLIVTTVEALGEIMKKKG